MITVRQIKLIEKYIPILFICEININSLMKEHNMLYAIGFIPKDCMTGNTWIEMYLSMAQVLNKNQSKEVLFSPAKWICRIANPYTHMDSPGPQPNLVVVIPVPNPIQICICLTHRHSHGTLSTPTHTNTTKICVQTSVYHLSTSSPHVETYFQRFWVFLSTTLALENQPQKRGLLLVCVCQNFTLSHWLVQHHWNSLE